MADTPFLLEYLAAQSAAWAKHPLSADSIDSLSMRIGLANALYDAVNEENRREGKRVEGDRGSLRDAFMRNMYGLWERWYEPVPAILQQLKEVPDAGASIVGADELIKRAEGVSRYLSAPVEKLITAMHDCEEGRGIPLEVLRNELRDRARARVPG